MAIFTVFMPRAASNGAEMADRALFVQDGFCWTALVFGPLWLVRHRLWLALALYILGAALIGTAAWSFGLRMPAASLLLALLSVFLGFEGRSLLCARLERRGYSLGGVVAGSQRDGLERRFFAGWLKQRAAAAGSGLDQ